MAKGLLLALSLLLAMGLGVVVFVLGLGRTIPALTLASEMGSLVARRRDLLGRPITDETLRELATLTRELRSLANADHVRAALDGESQAIEMARLAFVRGDPPRARDFLDRVGRTMIGSGEWRP